MKENILLKIKKIFLIAILLITLVLFYFYFSIYSEKKNIRAAALAPDGSPPMSKQFLLSDSDGNLSHLYMTGAIFYFAMQNPPEGFLVCDGSAISRSTYNTLFGVINNLYGNGDGNSTFNLPDLRGQFIRGFDSSGSVDTDRNKVGFGTKQEDALIAFSYSAGLEGGTINVGGSSGGGITQNGGPTWGSGRFSFDSRNFNVAGSGDKIKTSTETRPKNISLLPCIKY